MAIKSFFTQTLTLKRKSTTSERGVVVETLEDLGTFSGILDKATSSYDFSTQKEMYTITNILFCPTDLEIKEDDVVVYDSVEYDVRSVINPLYRQSHLECLLEERS